jgi:hypothetical protein
VLQLIDHAIFLELRTRVRVVQVYYDSSQLSLNESCFIFQRRSGFSIPIGSRRHNSRSSCDLFSQLNYGIGRRSCKTGCKVPIYTTPVTVPSSLQREILRYGAARRKCIIQVYGFQIASGFTMLLLGVLTLFQVASALGVLVHTGIGTAIG